MDELVHADVIMPLLSPDMMVNTYDELIQVLTRPDDQPLPGKLVIPVRVRHVHTDWLLEKVLRVSLPSNGLVVSEWRSRDAAWLDVVAGLRAMLCSPPPQPVAEPPLGATLDIEGRAPRVLVLHSDADFDAAEACMRGLAVLARSGRIEINHRSFLQAGDLIPKRGHFSDSLVEDLAAADLVVWLLSAHLLDQSEMHGPDFAALVERVRGGG